MATHLIPFLNRLAAALGAGGIFIFFSEYLFLNEGPVEGAILALRENIIFAYLGSLEFILYYAFFAYGFLICLSAFRVRNIWSLILAGSVFGWIVEGVIIPVMYEFPGVSYFWTAIGWHALIDVLIGFYLIRKILQHGNLLYTALIAIALGVFWSYWATWFWNEAETGGMAPIRPEDFAIFAAFVSSIWIGGTIVLDKLGGEFFTPSKFEIVIVGGLTLLGAIFMSLSAFPYSLTFWPLLALTIFGLWRASNNAAPNPEIFKSLCDNGVSWFNYSLLLLTPLTASLIYPFFFENKIGLEAALIVWPLIGAGAVAYLVALYQSLRITPA